MRSISEKVFFGMMDGVPTIIVDDGRKRLSECPKLVKADLPKALRAIIQALLLCFPTLCRQFSTALGFGSVRLITKQLKTVRALLEK